METHPQTSSKQLYTTIAAIIGWLAILLQFYLIIANNSATPVAGTILRFFSYFTILTNILVALCLTTLLLKPDSGWKKFLSKPATLAAVAVYIFIVGLVYNIILRFQWQPQGMQRIVDELLHAVMPTVFVLFWLLFVPKKSLQWKDVFSWLLYPFFYLIFILIRGALSGLYPYPFIDVTILGYDKVLVNCLFMFLAFLFVSLLVVGIAKISSKESIFKK
jgi:hypothetical protein